MSKKRTVFLTGATGLVASFLLKILLLEGHKVYALARGKKDKSARERIIGILNFWDESFPREALNNLVVIEGDITESNLGMTKDEFVTASRDIEIIFHSAALAEIKSPLPLIRNINVNGTKNVLSFAESCKNIVKFNHISTAYVLGKKYDSSFTEDMLENQQDFHNTYEQTKYEAELFIKEYKKTSRLRISIFRPGMVMGDSVHGRTTNFRLFYEPLHFFSKGIFEAFPADNSCFQYIIHVDTVAKALFLLREEESCDTYHLLPPNTQNVTELMKWASEYFSYTCPKFVPQSKFDYNSWTFVQKQIADPFVPYFNASPIFNSEKTMKKLAKYNFINPEIKKESFYPIFDFCNEQKFIRKR